ncbi:MAG TPA: EpsI family protein [Candidatus Dormibacteraeota bacterium]|nr:EpsI family protein [Candidatus Dormibacteraeota bacterium]
MLRAMLRGPRVAVAIAVLAAGTVLLHSANPVERVPLRRPLREFPMVLDQWQGTDFPFEARLVRAAGVDDYLNRRYTNRAGHSLELYIGYYQSQRTAQGIHSPKNCLPGAGWEPIRSSQLSIPTGSGRTATVNEYIVAKGRERDLVVYWFQSRGRSEASEYRTKLWLVKDAVIRHRTDGALVRVWAPLSGSEERVQARAQEFIQVLFSHLNEFVPD